MSASSSGDPFGRPAATCEAPTPVSARPPAKTASSSVVGDATSRPDSAASVMMSLSGQVGGRPILESDEDAESDKDASDASSFGCDGHPQRRGRSGGWQAAVRRDKAGYSTPSLVTRRRRRVTSFAFPFGGRANGRVYRQCRQRPQRTREPCTVRLRRRLLRALPLPAARAASVRLPPAARSPAACAAAGCRPPNARLMPTGCPPVACAQASARVRSSWPSRAGREPRRPARRGAERRAHRRRRSVRLCACHKFVKR